METEISAALWAHVAWEGFYVFFLSQMPLLKTFIVTSFFRQLTLRTGHYVVKAKWQHKYVTQYAKVCKH